MQDSKTCTGASKISALQLVHLFSALLSADPTYTGAPSALSAKIDPDGRLGITPKKVTRLVLESVATLRENGILVKTYRSNGKAVDLAPNVPKVPIFRTVGNIDPIDPVGCAERLHRAVRRVSPLCAAFCPDSECVRGSGSKSPRCADVRATRKSAGSIASQRREPRRGGENPPVREEPASHLASRRHPAPCQMPRMRAEAHTHYFVTKSAARVTPCGRGHSTLRSLAPQFQTKPASLGFCLVEGNERYGGKYAKKTNNSVFESQHRIWKRYAEKQRKRT